MKSFRQYLIEGPSPTSDDEAVRIAAMNKAQEALESQLLEWEKARRMVPGYPTKVLRGLEPSPDRDISTATISGGDHVTTDHDMAAGYAGRKNRFATDERGQITGKIIEREVDSGDLLNMRKGRLIYAPKGFDIGLIRYGSSNRPEGQSLTLRDKLLAGDRLPPARVKVKGLVGVITAPLIAAGTALVDNKSLADAGRDAVEAVVNNLDPFITTTLGDSSIREYTPAEVEYMDAAWDAANTKREKQAKDEEEKTKQNALNDTKSGNNSLNKTINDILSVSAKKNI